MNVLWMALSILVPTLHITNATNCTIIDKITECNLIHQKRNQPISIRNYTETLKLLPILSEIPAKTFILLPEITTLIINYTMVERLYIDSFEGLSKLKYLDLFWNQIQHLPNGIFDSCQHLIYLNLGGNNFDNLDGGIFRNLNELEILILSWNQLTTVPNMNYLQNLKLLDLSKNRIVEIDGTPFERLKNLRELNLKNNRIVELHGSSFIGLVNLQLFNIERNYLTDIDVDDICKNLQNLKEIHLSSNRFNCETLEVLIDQFMKRNIYIPEGLAEDELIHRHGIFCLPNDSMPKKINNDGLL